MSAHVLAYLYRRSDLSRMDFRDHYETRHTRLAQTLLPPFDHYVRNHVTASLGTFDVPDCISEFGYPTPQARDETARILRSDHADALRDDELRFMDKARNRAFAVRRRHWARPGALQNGLEKSEKTKYILWLAGYPWAERARYETVLNALRALDPALISVAACAVESSTGSGQKMVGDNHPANDPPSCWLCRSAAPIELEQMWRHHKDNKLPLLCCALVDEHIGYPVFD